MKQSSRNSAVYIRVKGKGVHPTKLVEYAVAIRDQSSEEFDEVWCVVDVDEFDLSAAIRQSEARGIRLAVSNPCFEVWLLLHFVDCTAPLRDPADALRRLKRHVPDYSKRELRFDRFGGGVADAITRARGLGEVGAEHVRNPSSGVWMVVQNIVGE